jgi:hypothetical protein
MLRISRFESSSGNVILRLEGSLIGPWVNELRSCCAAVCNNGHQLSLDLTELLFFDCEGLALLRILVKSNIGLAGCSLLLAEQLNRDNREGCG